MDDRTKKKPMFRKIPILDNIILAAIGEGRKKNRKRVFRESHTGYHYRGLNAQKGAFGKNPMKGYLAPTNRFDGPIIK